MHAGTARIVLAACITTLAVGCSSNAITSRLITSDTQISGAVTGIYYLPEARLQIRLEQIDEVASCAARRVDDADVSIPANSRTPAAILRHFSVVYVDKQIVPDRNAGYFLDYDESVWSTDILTIEITANGLLDRVHFKADDQTDQVILKIGDLAKEARKAFIAFGDVEGEAAALGQLPGNCVSFEFKGVDAVTILEWTFDPQRLKSVTAVNAAIKANIESHSSSRERGLPVIVVRANKLAVAVDPPPRKNSANVPNICPRGICYRPVEPFDFIVLEDDIEIRRKTVLLPAKNRVSQIDVSRATFVEKITTIDFEDGALKQVDINKPSEALAIVSLPVDILMAIVAIPAELIQLKIDTTNRDKDLVEANKNLIASQQLLLETQQKLLKKQRELAAEGKDSAIDSTEVF